MSIYTVIVLKTDGTLIQTEKEKESSAIKSAKMYVTVRGEQAAAVFSDGKVIFTVPDGIENDASFMDAARAKMQGLEAPVQVPKKKAASKPAKPAKAETKKDESLNAEAQDLIKEYDKAMKTGEIKAPVQKVHIGACTLEVLESACTGYLISRGATLDQVQNLRAKRKGDIEILAAKIAQGELTQDEAIGRLILLLQGNVPMTTQMPKEGAPVAPGIDLSKVLRGHKNATMAMKPSRIREDLGLSDGLEEMLPNTLPDGIVIYTKKESDEAVNSVLAFAMGYTPQSLINPHKASELEGYDYQRSIPLTRPDVKHPTWRAMGERIQSPSTLVKRISDQFSEDQVKIQVAQGIDLEQSLQH
jgi:hypothetical protein